jgi:hypothetical protein
MRKRDPTASTIPMNDTRLYSRRASLVLLVLLAVFPAAHSLAQPPRKPAPTVADFGYGPHERHVLDFWQASSARPTPFVLFIHGGGFANGSKENLRPDLLHELLAAGISVVAVNYRYYQQAPLPAALHDCRRALQVVRSKAKDWNLDKSRAAATGGSAGAIASMYLAFHDDMADLRSSDPIARESTRLTCVATTAGQTTLDTDWWVAHVPGWPKDEGVKGDGHAARRWGATESAAYQALVKDASAQHLISPDDPPIWMSYTMAPEAPPATDPKAALSQRVHHVAFGVALKRQTDALGVEAHLVHPGSKRQFEGLGHFLRTKLLSAASLSDPAPPRQN